MFTVWQVWYSVVEEVQRWEHELEVKKFRKRPVVVEAVQFDGLQIKNVLDAFGGKIEYAAFDGGDRLTLTIHTKEGKMNVSPGDWVIRGVKGEFYPCKPDIFKMTYEEVRGGSNND